MSRKRSILVAFLLIALLPTLLLAAPGERGRGRGPGGPGGHFMPPPGYLDLTADQIEAAQAIRDRVQGEMEGLRTQHQAQRDELHAALDSADPDPLTVGELVITLHGERQHFRAVIEAAEAEFSALLTDEQHGKWENWKELRQSRRERGPRGRGRGFGGGPHGPGFGGPPDAPGNGG